MRTCKKCFRAKDEDVRFCPHCGWDQTKDPKAQDKAGQEDKWSSGGSAQAGSRTQTEARQAESGPDEDPIYSFTPRSIALAVALSFLTGGLYIFWWIYRLMTEFNEVSRRQGQYPPGLSPGLAVVLTFLTGGLFMIYGWMVVCRQAASLKDASGQNLTDYTALCALTALAGLPGCLIGCAVMQNVLNLYIKYKM
jgi:hypothetical protein